MNRFLVYCHIVSAMAAALLYRKIGLLWAILIARCVPIPLLGVGIAMLVIGGDMRDERSKPTMSKNKTLSGAKSAKNDEFSNSMKPTLQKLKAYVRGSEKRQEILREAHLEVQRNGRRPRHAVVEGRSDGHQKPPDALPSFLSLEIARSASGFTKEKTQMRRIRLMPRQITH